MLKYLLLGVISLVSFGATIATALVVSGNLNRETLDRLLQRGPQLEADAPAAAGGEVGPLAQALREKEQQLEEREASLDAREKEQAAREESLKLLQEELAAQQKAIANSMEDEEVARRARVQSTAISIAEMKADKAAGLLSGGGFTPEEAAEILYFEANGKATIDKGDQGKILDAMDIDFATQVVRAQQMGGY